MPHRRRLARLAITLAAAAILTQAGCSSSKSCKSACEKIAKCLGIKLDAGGQGDAASSASWTCPLSDACDAKESCYGKCINNATCEGITGADAQQAKTLKDCQAVCDSKQADASLTDAKPKLDTTCTPSCAGKQCGPNGCGGSCGTCTPPKVCNTSQGQCTTSCTPSCAGRQCGDDGCGGSCGTCTPPMTCNAGGQCVSSCTPNCAGKQCGADGCGGSCGTCTPPKTCDTGGLCISTCSPDCTDKVCGDDGCGGSCGSCSSPQQCNAGTCMDPCPASFPVKGCCAGSSTLVKCSNGFVETTDCTTLGNPSATLCGWEPVMNQSYACTNNTDADPSYPRTCP